MGQVRSGKCESCGFSEEFTVGGSRSNYTHNDPFPVLCKTCKTITTINHADEGPRPCLRCGGFDYLVYGIATRDPGDAKEISLEFENLRRSALETARDKKVFSGREKSRRWEDFKNSFGWDRGRHLCPKCGKFDLRIQRPTLFFD